MANGPVASGSTGAKHVSSSSAESGINLPVSSMPSQEVNKLESTPAPTVIVIEKTGPAITSGSGDVDGQQPTSTSSNCSVSKTSDSCKPQLPETVGTSKREAGSQQTSVEPNVDFQDPKRPASGQDLIPSLFLLLLLLLVLLLNKSHDIHLIVVLFIL